jgi:cytochrome c5
MPADPKLAKLYAQTCKACHGNPASGAPQAGDRAAWQPRAAQGAKMLLEHAVNGYKGMPPLGSCMDCNETDFAALIAFMSGQGS